MNLNGQNRWNQNFNTIKQLKLESNLEKLKMVMAMEN